MRNCTIAWSVRHVGSVVKPLLETKRCRCRSFNRWMKIDPMKSVISPCSCKSFLVMKLLMSILRVDQPFISFTTECTIVSLLVILCCRWVNVPFHFRVSRRSRLPETLRSLVGAFLPLKITSVTRHLFIDLQMNQLKIAGATQVVPTALSHYWWSKALCCGSFNFPPFNLRASFRIIYCWFFFSFIAKVSIAVQCYYEAMIWLTNAFWTLLRRNKQTRNSNN